MKNFGTNKDEFQKIANFTSRLPPSSTRVRLGIGDDAAIVAPTGRDLLLCSDAMVEGVHFDLSYISPEELGHKALASCLSDLAAMNGRPLYALISLAVPSSLATNSTDDFLTRLYDGLGALAKRFKVDVVGGDLTRSRSDLFIDVSLVGDSLRPLTRSGARPNDLIAVTGTPGRSAAGLKLLRSGRARDEIAPDLLRAHLSPTPRFDALVELNKIDGLCTALIDVSDGLSSELHHIAERSGVGLELDLSRLPRNGLESYSQTEACELALSGGEDYELLATLNPDCLNQAGGHLPSFTIIGRVLAPDSGLHVIGLDGLRRSLVATGFNHFA